MRKKRSLCQYLCKNLQRRKSETQNKAGGGVSEETSQKGDAQLNLERWVAVFLGNQARRVFQGQPFKGFQGQGISEGRRWRNKLAIRVGQHGAGWRSDGERKLIDKTGSISLNFESPKIFLCVSVRVFSERITWGGNTDSDYGWYNPNGLDV